MLVQVLTPADDIHHINKHNFKVPFVCGCRDLGEALRRVAEGAAMIRTKVSPLHTSIATLPIASLAGPDILTCCLRRSSSLDLWPGADMHTFVAQEVVDNVGVLEGTTEILQMLRVCCLELLKGKRMPENWIQSENKLGGVCRALLGKRRRRSFIVIAWQGCA